MGKKKNKHEEIDPRIEEVLDGILHFVDCMEQYLIPVGEKKDDMKKASKKIRKKVDNYRKGEGELFTPEFYDIIESGESIEGTTASMFDELNY